MAVFDTLSRRSGKPLPRKPGKRPVPDPQAEERQPACRLADDLLAQFEMAAAYGPSLPSLDDLPPIPPAVRELVIDRLDAGYREGLFALTAEDYSGLMCALMPDEFAVPPCPSPTETIPLTESRLAVYALRVREAVAIFHRDDLAGDGERHGLLVDWSCGRTWKVKGLRKEGPAGVRPRKRCRTVAAA